MNIPPGLLVAEQPSDSPPNLNSTSCASDRRFEILELVGVKTPTTNRPPSRDKDPVKNDPPVTGIPEQQRNTGCDPKDPESLEPTKKECAVISLLVHLSSTLCNMY